jgi:glycosyltransferase involved in cell wall biosynthesis
MKKAPTVSVIIPTYKRPRECLRAVKSVLMQSFRDFEIIVGNDFGGDETESLLKNLEDPRIRYFDNERQGGSASKNRNLCVARARGEFLTFLDSDDFILPSKLMLQREALKNSDSQVGFVISGTRVVKLHKGKYYHYKDLIPTAEGDVSDAYFRRTLSCYNTSMMVKHEALLAVRTQELSTFWFDHDVDSFSSDQLARLNGLESFLSKHEGLLSEYPDWAESRISELVKLSYLSGEFTHGNHWYCRLKSPNKKLFLMHAFSKLPFSRRVCSLFYRSPFLSKVPSWMNTPVNLDDLIADELRQQIKPLL